MRLSGRRDSNPRPSAWEADALPTELLPLDNDNLKKLLSDNQGNILALFKIGYSK